ncbi:unnamed protein product, partial [Medioppia subpectinata]
MKVLCLLSLLYLSVNSLPVNEFNGKNWVVLVAGSNTWGNYRHQADVYHAYQIVYNGPTGHNGTDVYHGVPKHYTGKEVTPENFLKVLAGDKGLKKAGKKVLESGPNDHVFIFFDDHGSPDLVAFPDKYLYAKLLMKTLKQMHQDKKYAKLVFYIEACKS